MSKRVVIVHGWADDPSRGWINWLVGELQQQGIEAAAPHFPGHKRPDMAEWLPRLSQTIGRPDHDLVLVGHSLGCLLIIRYLSDLDPDVRLAGIVLVAGMADIPRWRHPALFDPPLNYGKVKSIAKRRICIYSNDDDRVLPARTKELAGLIDAELILDPGKGHFAGLHGCIKLKSAMQAVQSCYT